MKIERQLQGTLNTIFTEVVRERGLDHLVEPYTTQEENRADITLKHKNGKTIFFIELKDPTAKDGKSVFDANVVLREATRAQKYGIQYFGNCNFLACGFFDVEKFYEKVSVNEGFFSLNDIIRLGNSYSPGKDILAKLKTIATFYLDRALEIIQKKPVRFSELDVLFIFKIRKLIEVYAPAISQKVWEKYEKNKQFEKSILAYTQAQLWNKPSTFEEIENLTHISLLMLISKLIFYKTYVDNRRWHTLHPMSVDEDISDPVELEKSVWQYFETFKEVTGNFELLIGERSDIIFQLPFVSAATIDLVKDVLDTEGHYNFSKIPFDIIGRIFEELIREDERHKLGQYFTPPTVIDLINAFAIRDASDKVLDPSCGSGTFLVRAYERKRVLGSHDKKDLRHEDLLNEIYGNDLSGYPAYLSMLNLAIRNSHHPSYPRIINKDFFAVTENSKVNLHSSSGEPEYKPLPKFNAIIGNPPYTRQEDIGTMRGTQTKAQIQSLILRECNFEPSQRTSIYVYFFYHADTFLKENGYLAYIVQNSWLDTEYGADLQQYLLNNYEIIAIMDSEVERFFPSASVNTSIVILRKQRNEDIRRQNIARFVYFTEKLSEIVNIYDDADRLRDVLISANTKDASPYFKVNCLLQDDLAKDNKWGKFLKAPKLYFDIMEKGKGKWTVLSELSDVKFGTKTGCNDFFLLKDVTKHATQDQLAAVVNNIDHLESIQEVKKRELRIVENGWNELWLVEQVHLKPMLTSSKEVNSYDVKPAALPHCVLQVQGTKHQLKTDSPYLLRYIQHAERNNIHTASSLASRNQWYNLGELPAPDMSFNYIINDYGRTFKLKASTNNNFHNIYVKGKNARSIWLYLNSTIGILFQQLIMRSNLGDGAGKIETYELASFPIIAADLESLEVDLGNTQSYVKDLAEGTADTTKIDPSRVKLDDAILKAIGFDEINARQQILKELYPATFHLINARIKKAQSLKSVKSQRKKVEFNVYVEQLKQSLVEENVSAKNTQVFARQCEKLVQRITSDKKLQLKILTTYWKEKFGELYDKKNISQKSQTSMF